MNNTTATNFVNSPLVALATLLFFLLPAVLMAHQHHTLPPLASSTHKPTNTNPSQPLLTSQNRIQDRKTETWATTSATPTGRRGGPSYKIHRRSPSWRQRALNASAHEVPSGPNPISNR
ncbi:hypothetical protein LguiA_024833 [Lonicera macranthoides]